MPRLKDIECDPGIEPLRLRVAANYVDPIECVAVPIRITNEELGFQFLEFFLAEHKLVSPLEIEFYVSVFVQVRRITGNGRRNVCAQDRIS